MGSLALKIHIPKKHDYGGSNQWTGQQTDGPIDGLVAFFIKYGKFMLELVCYVTFVHEIVCFTLFFWIKSKTFDFLPLQRPENCLICILSSVY